MKPVGTTVAIAVGGAVGALARYGVAVATPHADGAFPVATFGTNVVGCLLIGVLMAVVERGGAPDWARPALGVGVLGGFTTFSAYALEITGLLDRPVVALAYLFGTVVAALAASWVGLAGTRRLLK